VGAAVAVSTRHGGTSVGPYASLNLGLHVDDDPSCVTTNRRLVCADFGVDPSSTVFAQQIHGAGIARVAGDHGGRGFSSQEDALPDADVLVTTEPGVTLFILVADCVPLTLIDPVARILAVVHAGWRGTAAQVAPHAVSTMVELGGDPARMVAYIGPAVPQAGYQVDDVVHDALRNSVAPPRLAPGAAQPDGVGHWLIDLPAINRSQLQLAGLLPEHITVSAATTADEDYFSDRLERPCGRFAMMAHLLG
jgi:YfiH family protein